MNNSLFTNMGVLLVLVEIRTTFGGEHPQNNKQLIRGQHYSPITSLPEFLVFKLLGDHLSGLKEHVIFSTSPPE